MELTTEQAHRLTGLSRGWLRELARRGWVKAGKEGREWRFDEPVLRAYLPGQWISIAEASTKTDYPPRRLRSLAERGRIQAERVNGFWLVKWESVLAYLHEEGAEGD